MPSGERRIPHTIVHVVESSLAGVGRHVADLSAVQAANGHDVHVVWSGIREDERFRSHRRAAGPVQFHQFDMQRNPAIADLTVSRRLGSLLAALRPTVVHAHSSKAGMLTRSRWRRPAPTVLYTPHAMISLDPTLTGFQSSIAQLVERRLAERTDFVIAVSRHELDHFHLIGIDPQRTRLIPNGIAPADPRPDRSDVRRDLGLPDRAPVVGFVGRLVNQKNPGVLLDAVPHLARDVHLAIVGDGPLWSELQKAIARHSADGRVHLLGERDGHRAMFGFDCLVLPSRYESNPYAMWEAMDARIPVVVGADASWVDGWRSRHVRRAASSSAADLAKAITASIVDTTDVEFGSLPTIQRMAADLEGLFTRR